MINSSPGRLWSARLQGFTLFECIHGWNGFAFVWRNSQYPRVRNSNFTQERRNFPGCSRVESRGGVLVSIPQLLIIVNWGWPLKSLTRALRCCDYLQVPSRCDIWFEIHCFLRQFSLTISETAIIFTTAPLFCIMFNPGSLSPTFCNNNPFPSKSGATNKRTNEEDKLTDIEILFNIQGAQKF